MLNKIDKQMLNFNPATKEEVEQVKNESVKIAVGKTAPTDKTVKIWIDTSS